MSDFKYKGIDSEAIRKIQFEEVPFQTVLAVSLEETIKGADKELIQQMQSEIERFVQKQVDRRVEEAELLCICEMAILYLQQRNAIERIVEQLTESKEHYRRLWNKNQDDEDYGALSAYEDAIDTVKEEGGIE